MTIKTTYLQMLSHAKQVAPPPRDGRAIVHVPKPSVAFYRSLYDAVGARWQWGSRKRLSDADLATIIQDPRVELHVLHVDGVPAGFAELDRRSGNEIELVQFGLTPEFIGQGLGRWFLQWTIDKAWSYQPSRFWLHTCTNDHPGALANYLKRGFEVFKEETKEN